MLTRLPLVFLVFFLACKEHCSIPIDCVQLNLVDHDCACFILKSLDKFINIDKNYSNEIPPVKSALEYPVRVNVSMGLNHIPDVNMLAGTVRVCPCLFPVFTYNTPLTSNIYM